MNILKKHFMNKSKRTKKRKIKGYMVFDSYEIMDTNGDYTAVFKVFINNIHTNQFIGYAIFK